MGQEERCRRYKFTGICAVPNTPDFVEETDDLGRIVTLIAAANFLGDDFTVQRLGSGGEWEDWKDVAIIGAPAGDWKGGE